MLKKNARPTVIGIISDTHGLLRPEAVAALRGSDMILHAGDVGSQDILDGLRQIAPLTVVRGNVDRADWVREQKLAETELIEIGKISIYMLHDLEQLDLKPKAAGISAVVYGHSHMPREEVKDGVLYFNPGSAGPRRFKLPVSVGKLVVEGSMIRHEVIELAVGA